jgi:hypothetical protein
VPEHKPGRGHDGDHDGDDDHGGHGHY